MKSREWLRGGAYALTLGVSIGGLAACTPEEVAKYIDATQPREQVVTVYSLNEHVPLDPPQRLDWVHEGGNLDWFTQTCYDAGGYPIDVVGQAWRCLDLDY